MKIAIIGGGPAGLYSAILLKKQRPASRHHGVRAQPRRRHLRLRRGVLRRDARQFRELRSARAIAASPRNFAYWDDIEIHFRGTRAPDRRQRLLRLLARTLLLILQERARELGVDLMFEAEIDG